MEEQILIKSERSNIKKTTIIIAIILSVLFILISIARIMQIRNWNIEEAETYKNLLNLYTDTSKVHSPYYYSYIDDGYVLFGIIGTIIVWIISIIFINAFSKTELYVTNSRVYGISIFDKRVDLPIDAITAVGTGIFNTISISTASGVIKFKYLKNRNSIHECINNLVISRQQKENNNPTSQTTINQEIPLSNADELKKYKELLDSGIINQEEFNAKKKQLLQ
jgi:hypothetical protein